ncbi:MAG TPA: pyruvate dehydrogenase complex dihydrolipoamide acetyltransferase [Puia sp.]|nr:pyruvate dehydrogenase complex dihydrolipoamide acetyltransferase [Puia sp.]
MAEVILMPRLSDTMTEGVIAAWHKKVGDNVKKGDLLAEVETDKATMDLESYKDGTLLFTGTDKGGKVQVNDLLAIIGKPGEDISSLVKSGGAAAPSSTAPAKADTAAPAPSPVPSPAPAAADTKKPAAPAMDLSAMQEVILMPRLSDTMTEGVIAAWHKKVGDQVKKGDILADIETDKATMELESYKEGKLLYTGAEKGQKVAVNDLLAIIGEEGKVNVQQIVDASKNKGASPTAAKEPAAQPADLKTADQPAAKETHSLNGDGRIKASPLAKKMASEKGIDLSQLHGSGDSGRIIKKDVAEYSPAASASAPIQKVAVSTAPAGQVSFDDIPVSQMRKVIAKRLAEAKFSAPEFYLTITVDMDQAVSSRTRINENAPVKISFNDFVLKATALALKKHPAVNSSWMGDKIRVNHHVNIGVAVAVEDGLLVPVVRFADTKSLSQISQEVKEFAARAKNKKLQPADWEGSTFTISNLGMFGMDEFTAIINPPDACILAVSSIQQIPVVKNGAIVPGNVMKLTMTCDHRVVDGATGAAFLQTLKGLLEEPLRMLV